jgi:hypothetical protein
MGPANKNGSERAKTNRKNFSGTRIAMGWYSWNPYHLGCGVFLLASMHCPAGLIFSLISITERFVWPARLTAAPFPFLPDPKT